MKSSDALSHLLSVKPVALSELPKVSGLYALHNHLGAICYLGVTHMGIHKRIFRYHVAGDNNSHKYSTAYNAGRMWYDKKLQLLGHYDGAIAKELRRGFARKYCCASALPLGSFTKSELFQLESEVRTLAPREIQTWNDNRTIKANEPEPLVDALLIELKWPGMKIDAVLRQSERWNSIVQK